MIAQGEALGNVSPRNIQPQRGGPNRTVALFRAAPLGLSASNSPKTQGCALGCLSDAPLGLIL